jgi:hypothetical protein
LDASLPLAQLSLARSQDLSTLDDGAMFLFQSSSLAVVYKEPNPLPALIAVVVESYALSLSLSPAHMRSLSQSDRIADRSRFTTASSKSSSYGQSTLHPRSASHQPIALHSATQQLGKMTTSQGDDYTRQAQLGSNRAEGTQQRGLENSCN